MSEKRKLKDILETIGVVVGSLVGGIIIITTITIHSVLGLKKPSLAK